MCVCVSVLVCVSVYVCARVCVCPRLIPRPWAILYVISHQRIIFPFYDNTIRHHSKLIPYFPELTFFLADVEFEIKCFEHLPKRSGIHLNRWIGDKCLIIIWRHYLHWHSKNFSLKNELLKLYIEIYIVRFFVNTLKPVIQMLV